MMEMRWRTGSTYGIYEVIGGHDDNHNNAGNYAVIDDCVDEKMSMMI